MKKNKNTIVTVLVGLVLVLGIVVSLNPSVKRQFAIWKTGSDNIHTDMPATHYYDLSNTRDLRYNYDKYIKNGKTAVRESSDIQKETHNNSGTTFVVVYDNNCPDCIRMEPKIVEALNTIESPSHHIILARHINQKIKNNYLPDMSKQLTSESVPTVTNKDFKFLKSQGVKYTPTLLIYQHGALVQKIDSENVNDFTKAISKY